MGKTSLIMNLRKVLDPKTFVIVYVDLFATESEESFATATAKAIASALESKTDHVLEVAKRLFSRFTPSVGLDEEGKPQLSLGMSRNVEIKETIEEVLRAPAKVAAETSRHIIVVFDEFHRINEYDEGDRVERLIRTIIQHQPEVGYIFMGSRKHLIRGMFLNKSRPLYRSADHYPLGPIEVSHWRSFIRSKFEQTGRKISNALVDQICTYTEGHPSYTQQLCHAIWGGVDDGKTVRPTDIEKGIQQLLQRESYAYTILWESLPLNQRRLLRGLALEDVPVSTFGAAFVSKYALGSASSIQRAAEGLEDRDVIERDAKRYFIGDRFFKSWLRKRESALGLA